MSDFHKHIQAAISCREAEVQNLRSELHRVARQRDEACDENKKMKGLLLYALYYHQGSQSPVGQPIREFLGIGQFDQLTDEQLVAAKKAGVKR